MRYRLSREAASDIRLRRAWIEHHHDRASAERFIEFITAELRSLALVRSGLRLRSDPSAMLYVAGKYMIAYRVEKVIEVFAVLHASRDPRALEAVVAARLIVRRRSTP